MLFSVSDPRGWRFRLGPRVLTLGTQYAEPPGAPQASPHRAPWRVWFGLATSFWKSTGLSACVPAVRSVIINTLSWGWLLFCQEFSSRRRRAAMRFPVCQGWRGRRFSMSAWGPAAMAVPGPSSRTLLRNPPVFPADDNLSRAQVVPCRHRAPAWPVWRREDYAMSNVTAG